MDTTKYPFGENGWNPTRLGSQVGKTFVITGGNSGAGFEATKLLVSRGAKIVMLTRDAKEQGKL
jgi:NAD(P)-dependent dehydrogenase (short-subunit alcohol dehydrogenase family)